MRIASSHARWVHLALLAAAMSAAGCLRPIRTDSSISFPNPLAGHVTAELQLQAKNNLHPLVEMPVDGKPCKGPKIALVDVDGLLLNQNATGIYSNGENPVDLFRERLDTIAADDEVCAVVLRLNSPGGAVTATDIMWQDFQRFRARTGKPVVVCLLDHGCSGAYYLATASNLIIAHPTTITGGVGVLLNHFNLQDFLGVFSITHQTIKGGPNIDMGSSTAPLSPEAKKLLQSAADEFHQRFRDVIKQQRPDVDMADASNFDGRVFTAKQALDRKLIDRIGYIDDAFEAAREFANQPRARVVVYRRPNDLARTPYATSPNQPMQQLFVPFNVPGVDRSRLPTFLYLWQPDPSLVRLGGT